MCSLTWYWSATENKDEWKQEANGVAKEEKFYSDKQIKPKVIIEKEYKEQGGKL